MSLPITLETSPNGFAARRPVAWVAVVVARLLSRLSPLWIRRTLETVRKGARPATVAEATVARQSVVAVSRRCAGQQCLQRAIATALLCRLTGTWPDWRTGVRTEPFRAHAWVEVDGQAIGEREDMRLYRTVFSVPARHGI